MIHNLISRSAKCAGGPLAARRRVFAGAICLSLGANVAAAGPEFSWVPVAANGAFTLAGSDGAGQPTEIILYAGYPHRGVEFELRVNGWGAAEGPPILGSYQAVLDATGFLGVNASPFPSASG